MAQLKRSARQKACCSFKVLNSGFSNIAIFYDTAPPTFTSTNIVLDGISSFFNNLFAKSQWLPFKDFLDGFIEMDLQYTLTAEGSYNFVPTVEGITGEDNHIVAKSQIASLVADVFSNTEVTENKVYYAF
ncbi:NAD(P)-binding domain-containing protein [Artemisia annua]|uniref:NAD(P)-binding domain-containing protein n=1 Tax=Artemisia annua TaxID=35608 RepID=A0A2U1MTQ9_ARTAN|nr:NAD(P)-binding domain-containing protein [Artemisia annua]